MTGGDGKEVVSASFECHECGSVAATVYFVPPLAADPRDPSGVTQEVPRLSIEGGPTPVTISRAGEWAEAAVSALRARDVAALRAVDAEFAPFWCTTCAQSYCKQHWQTNTVYDEGFFDYVEGHCPAGHRQLLMD